MPDSEHPWASQARFPAPEHFLQPSHAAPDKRARRFRPSRSAPRPRPFRGRGQRDQAKTPARAWNGERKRKVMVTSSERALPSASQRSTRVQAGKMAAAGAGRLRRAASALLLRSPRLPARELSAPARLYHKKVWAGEGVREPSRGPAAVAQITTTEDPAATSAPPRPPLRVSQL